MANQKKERNPSLRIILAFFLGMVEVAAARWAIDAFKNDAEWELAASGAVMLWVLLLLNVQGEIINHNFVNKKRTILNQQRKIQDLERQINQMQNQH